MQLWHSSNDHFYHCRVDPTAVSGIKPETPLEIILESYECWEVLPILAEFMEMPDHVKLIQLALLINSDEAEQSNEEIHRILTSLPVEMVGNFNIM